ncbi:MAG: extracellular solute-binding protein [Bacteroidota bacterium]
MRFGSASIPLALSLFLLCGMSSCSTNDPTKEKLVVYSPHGKELLTEFERQYEALRRDVDVLWLDMGSQAIYDRLWTERKNPQADIWWGAPSILFRKAEQEGLLAPFVPTWDSAVTLAEKSARGFWYGTFLTPEVIAYNTRLLSADAAPKDWDELLQPRWRNKIVLRYPLASGTMRMIFSALIAREITRTGDVHNGFRWLRRLDANTKSYAANPTQLYLKLAREEAPVTVWNLPDIELQVQVHGYPFGYVMPQSGTPMIVDAIALVAGSDQPEVAREFYEFVTRRESMILQAEKFFRIPARNDIEKSALPGWVSRLDLKRMEVDWLLISEREREWMRYWEENIKGRGVVVESEEVRGDKAKLGN